jgi:hypothetical protein
MVVPRTMGPSQELSLAEADPAVATVITKLAAATFRSAFI